MTGTPPRLALLVYSGEPKIVFNWSEGEGVASNLETRATSATAEPCVRQFHQTFAAEAWIMASMHDPHRQGAQSFHGVDVILDIGARNGIQERTIIDGVTRKKHSSASFP